MTTFVAPRALTREEAQRRAELIAVDSYDIHLDLTGSDTGTPTFGTHTSVEFTCSEVGASTFAEFRSTEPAEAWLNGEMVPIADGRIGLDNLAAQNTLVVKGRGVYSTSGEGLHRSVDPADGAVYVYSNCFLHDASRVFACFDQPDLKAVFRLSVSAPPGWTVVSNSARSAADAQAFEPTPPLSTYLVALAAGPYASAHDSWTSADGGSTLPLGLFCRQSMAAYLEEDDVFATTKAGLDFYSSQFNSPYPFSKLDQLFAPEFNGGAMENVALVIHTDEFLFRGRVTDAERETRAMIVLHELAHMWFGDLVTMRWWDDLWLNEAFATYCSYLATAEVTRFSEAWTTFCVQEKTNGRVADLRPSRHPVSGDVPDTDAALLNFDAISYNKGASLLRQLSERVGRETFFGGVHHYFGEHAWGNTDLRDFMQALEKAGAGSLGHWSDQNLKSVGCPTVGVATTANVTSDSVDTIAITQRGTLTDQRVGVGLYRLQAGRLVAVQRLDTMLDGARTPLDSVSPGEAQVIIPNDRDWAYASIELDDRSLETLFTAGVSAFEDSLPRALVWGALWDMTISGALPASRFIDEVAAALAEEDHTSIIELLLERAAVASEQFVTAERTSGLRSQLAEACFEAAGQTEAGSERRLALVRGHIMFATTPEQLHHVAQLLDGPAEQPGVIVDADLRWRLLHTLVAMGHRPLAAIDAELQRDSTAFGRYRADRARAAFPSAPAKELAWAAATGASEASTNRTVLESCLGFWQWNQRELCQPFVSRYFSELDQVWATRDTEIAHEMTTELFPAGYVDNPTLQLLDRRLSRDDLPAGQRRILADRRFDLARALEAQG